jgi:hypothetical protein
MAIPDPIKDVPRNRVHAVVRAMLLSAEVADIRCKEAKDGTYTVTPSPRKKTKKKKPT